MNISWDPVTCWQTLWFALTKPNIVLSRVCFPVALTFLSTASSQGLAPLLLWDFPSWTSAHLLLSLQLFSQSAVKSSSHHVVREPLGVPPASSGEWGLSLLVFSVICVGVRCSAALCPSCRRALTLAFPLSLCMSLQHSCDFSEGAHDSPTMSGSPTPLPSLRSEDQLQVHTSSLSEV